VGHADRSQTEVLVADGRDPFHDVLRESASDADIVLMGMRSPGPRRTTPTTTGRLQERTRGASHGRSSSSAAEEITFRDVLFREPPQE
jgi:hypothetical protein